MADRVIKFRCWDKKNKVMRWVITRIDWLISGKPIRVHWMTSERDEGVLYNRADWVDGTDEFILEQFTGLLDKNGKEIYESDIVIEGPHESKMEVVFGDYEFNTGICEPNSRHDYVSYFLGWHLKPIKRYKYQDGETEKLTHGEDFEIIGNVHDTQEAK